MKKIICLILSLTLVLIDVAFVQTQGKPPLALLSLHGIDDVSESVAIQITRFLQEELFNSGKYELIDRSRVDKAANEYQLQKPGLYDLESAINIGNKLAVSKVIYGTVGKLGDAFSVQIDLVDVDSRKIEKPASILAKCNIEDLPKYLNELVAKVFGATAVVQTKLAEEITLKDQVEIKKEEEQKPLAIGGEFKEDKATTAKKKFPWIIVAGIMIVVGAAVIYLLTKQKTGNIQVNSTPSGARIYLDEIVQNKYTPSSMNNVSPGSHTIKLVKGGYQNYLETISLSAGKTISINATLKENISITVNQPSLSSIWEMGSQQEIRWTTNLSISDHINIDLFKSGGGVSTIVSDISNTGSYQWTVPASLPAGTDYKIRISDSNNVDNYGDSDNFRITHIVITITQPSLTSNWERGYQQEIRWVTSYAVGFKTSNNAGNNVNIDLYKGGNKTSSITSNTTNSGSYQWISPSSLSEGSDYKIRITDINNISNFSESANFTVSYRCDPRGNWKINLSAASYGYTGDGYFTCSGNKESGSVSGSGTQRSNNSVANFTFSGTYSLNGTYLTISGVSSLGVSFVLNGQFTDENHINGTGDLGIPFNWDAVRQ